MKAVHGKVPRHFTHTMTSNLESEEFTVVSMFSGCDAIPNRTRSCDRFRVDCASVSLKDTSVQNRSGRTGFIELLKSGYVVGGPTCRWSTNPVREVDRWLALTQPEAKSSRAHSRSTSGHPA